MFKCFRSTVPASFLMVKFKIASNHSLADSFETFEYLTNLDPTVFPSYLYLLFISLQVTFPEEPSADEEIPA